MGDRLGIRDAVDILPQSIELSRVLSPGMDLPSVNVYGHIMLKAPVLVRSLKLSNIESR
jgi:hypothetical protein